MARSPGDAPMQLRHFDHDAILPTDWKCLEALIVKTDLPRLPRTTTLWACTRWMLTLLTLSLAMTGCMGAQNRPMQLISGAGPVYPAQAKAAGIEGEVVVRYDITVAGGVENARVESADPVNVFDDAALAAVRSWRYNPRIREGVVESVQDVLSTVRFRLSDGDVRDRY